jgi:hypothetical protein
MCVELVCRVAVLVYAGVQWKQQAAEPNNTCTMERADSTTSGVHGTLIPVRQPQHTTRTAAVDTFVTLCQTNACLQCGVSVAMHASCCFMCRQKQSQHPGEPTLGLCWLA